MEVGPLVSGKEGEPGLRETQVDTTGQSPDMLFVVAVREIMGVLYLGVPVCHGNIFCTLL